MSQEIQKTEQGLSTHKNLSPSIVLLKKSMEGVEGAMAFMNCQAEMTVVQSFEGKTIRAIELSGESTFELIMNLLSVTAKALNVSKSLNEFQAYDIAKTIISDYKDVKIEELIYIFKQGKKGLYGPHYNKLDIETIIGWINGYFSSNEYNDYLENRHKVPIEKTELTQEQKDWWVKLAKEFKEKKPFDGNVKKWAKDATIEQLNSMLADFESAKYQEGIDQIKNEINQRNS